MIDQRLYKLSRTSSEIVSVVAVIAMLCGAMVVVSDVVQRWTLGQGTIALNELMSMIFAVAIAATLPAGMSRRSSLRVDLLKDFTSERLAAWLTVFGSVLMVLFLGLLAKGLWDIALKYYAQQRATLILLLKIAPFFLGVAAALSLAVVAQIAVLFEDIQTALRTKREGRTSLVMWVILAIFFGVIAVGVYWAATDFGGLKTLAAARPATIVLIAFGLLWFAILCRLHVAAAMALTGMAGTSLFIGPAATVNVFATDAADFITSAQVATLPLFLIMGSLAVVGGISQDIYTIANAVFGRVRGGLAYATVLGCAGFGSVSGSSLATAATFGRIALPEMDRRGYAGSLSSGVVAAGGTLGSLVPPSGAIILFALLTEQGIGQLFMAAMVPALVAVILYFAAIFITVRRNPEMAPDQSGFDDGQGLLMALVKGWPVFVIFGVVIGGLYSGIFTATESAAVGAVSAFLIALIRGKLTRATILDVMSQTVSTTAMIYSLIFGALSLTFFVDMGQSANMVLNYITSLDIAPTVVLIILLLLYLLLGSVMDSFAVMVITVPIVTPVVISLGFDMLHWGILMLVVVEIGLITPPFGMNLFILQSLRPGRKLSEVFRGVLPFVAADAIKLAILVSFPILATWLPSTLN